MEADGTSSGSGPASSPPRRVRGRRLAGVWRRAGKAFRAGRNRLEPTMPGRVWKQLSELGFISNSLQFAAVFTLGFIPFLNVILTVLGSGLFRGILIRSGFSAQASRDVTMLFAHGRTAAASLSMPGLGLAVLGGCAISHMIQTWYAKIFRTRIRTCCIGNSSRSRSEMSWARVSIRWKSRLRQISITRPATLE